MGCLDHCTSGSHAFAGRNVVSLSYTALAAIRNQSMGFVFQSFFLLPRLNALHNVLLPLLYRDIPRKQAKQSAMNMLDKVGVTHLAAHKPHQLCGEQQRIAIARALDGNPDVIFADEPTGALDLQTGHDIMTLFMQLNREGRTIIIITHDNAISQRCQRIVTMKDGQCVPI